MQVKRFFAKESHKVLRLVREDLGPDAVIIANRQVDGGVEIIASSGYDETNPDQVLDISNDISEGPVAVESEEKSVQNEYQESMSDMRSEIYELRGMLESQFSALKVSHWGQRDQIHAELFRRLTKIGLGIDLSTRLADVCGKQSDITSAQQKALNTLASNIKISSSNIIDEGGLVVLVGSTGSGKTTTLAKLAAQYSMKHGRNGIVLVSADQRRIGAHEQLLVFGRLLGVPVLQAKDKQELDAMLVALSDKELVLVDSSGLGQKDLHHPEYLPDIQSEQIQAKQYLVMPATMQTASMSRMMETVKSMQIKGCILTKVDEAIVLGDAIESLITHKIPLVYWTDGQNIQGDLYQAKAVDLVSKAVSLARYRSENKDDRIIMNLLHSGKKNNSLNEGSLTR